MAAPPTEEAESQKGFDRAKEKAASSRKNTKVSLKARQGGLDLEGRKDNLSVKETPPEEFISSQKAQTKFDNNISSGFVENPQPDTSGTLNADFEFSSEFDRIDKQLYSIPADYLRLVTARCVLRVFPLAVREVISQAATVKQPNTDIDIAVLWRATLMLWTDSIDESRIDSIQQSIQKFAELHIPLPASEAIAATAVLLNEPVTEDPVSLFSETCRACVAAIASQPNADEQEVRVAIEMIEQDTAWIDKHSGDAATLRRQPLWHDLELKQDGWQNQLSILLDRFKDLDFSFISQPYQAFLNESWEENHSARVIIKGSAELRPEDDSPALKDSLGREALVKALVPRLSDNGDHSHLTIGLLGNWGIGKTSVLRQLQAALDKDIHNQYLFGEFNAWSYEHTGNLQAGLAHEVISALTTANPKWFQLQRWFHKPWVIAKYSIKLHGKKLLFAAVLVLIVLNSGLIGKLKDVSSSNLAIFGGSSLVALWFLFDQVKKLLSQPLAKELKTYLKLPDTRQYLGTIPEMKKNIRDLCDICLGPGWWGNNRRLIFFIDDLDRCDVEGIVKTFEAIRLVLDRDWVTVVIAMDQRIALPALACNYKKLSEFHQRDPMSIARDYLGKVIHLPIRLDEPNDLAVAQYLTKIWNDDGFLQQIKTELGQTPDAPDSSPRQDETGENKPQSQAASQQVDREPLENIIKDIESVDVKAVFSEADDKPPEENRVDGFGPQQKDVFYRWLLKFNLRNPRQIKRLYNSFNLLWSIYDESWQRQSGDAWRPNMLGLLVLEMINENVKFDAKEDYRGQYRQLIFESTRWKKIVAIENVDEADVKQSRSDIQKYQKQSGCDLLQRLKPFVLPAVRPDSHGNASP